MSEDATNYTASPEEAPRKGSIWAAIAGWIVSLGLGFVGVAMAFGDNFWPNEHVFGTLLTFGGAVLVPPIWRRLRRRIPGLRPRWTPIAFVLLLVIAANVISRPFTPPPQQQARLKEIAIGNAQALLREGRPKDAELQLSHLRGEIATDPVVRGLFTRIDEAERANTNSTRTATSSASEHVASSSTSTSPAPQPVPSSEPSTLVVPPSNPTKRGFFESMFHPQATRMLQNTENEVAAKEMKAYEMAKQNGTPIDICVQAGLVSAAYLQANDGANYPLAKAREKVDCQNAGVPQ